MKIHERNIGRLTIVTGNGKVLQTGDDGGGVLIVDSMAGKPIVEISEVSDSETVNLFLHLTHSSGIGRIDCQNGDVIKEDDMESTHEILVNREEQKPLRNQDGSPATIPIMRDGQVIEFKTVGRWYLDVCYSELGLEHVIGYLTDTDTGDFTSPAVFQPSGNLVAAFKHSTLEEWKRRGNPLPVSLQNKLFAMMRRIARKLRRQGVV